MADYMELTGKSGDELPMEERNLVSAADKNTLGNRRAAWRIITRVWSRLEEKGQR